MNLPPLCYTAIQNGASDIIFHLGEHPSMRVSGTIHAIPDTTPVTEALLLEIWKAAGQDTSVRDADAAVVLEDGQRFRASLFHQLGTRAAVLRVVRRDIPSLHSLGLPVAILLDWLSHKSGLVLVTGPTNSGKSTTLAACIADMAQSSPRHIITVEDPVEFIFEHHQSIITQREVGIDTPSFPQALHQALRQSPDVIFIGEIRDSESAVTALQATETGHLVLASVHGNRTTDAIERITQLIPGDLRPMLARVLAANLVGVLAQRLIPGLAGDRVPSVEYVTNAGAVRPMIEQSRLDDLKQLIERSSGESARSQNMSLLALCRKGRISEEEALAASDARSDLSLQLKGITNRTF
jgi:twitching motility protein PilT